MKCILGKKLGMTQVFREDGSVVPVTRVQAGPCIVTQVKSENGNVKALQIGFGTQKTFRLNKPQVGHLKGITVEPGVTVRHLKEVPTSQELKRGDRFTVSIFTPGEKVKVVGTSKGRGFQGVVKRHGFKGGPASHGHKDNLRAPGSIGAGGVQRVFKGIRMAGHMGNAQVTVDNLEIVEVHSETNELLIKGAVPGGFGSLVFITTPEGELTVEVAEEKAPEAPASESETKTDTTSETVESTNEETPGEPVAEEETAPAPAAEAPATSEEPKQ